MRGIGRGSNPFCYFRYASGSGEHVAYVSSSADAGVEKARAGRSKISA